MINIVLILVLVAIIYFIFKGIDKAEYDINHKFDENKCKLDKFNIDNLHILKRDKEYSNLINKLINDKKVKFTDKELDILKNKYQFYDVKDKYDIKNMSYNVNGNCKNPLIKEGTNPVFNNSDVNPNQSENEKENQNDKDNLNKFTSLDNGKLDIKLLGDVQYNEILKKLKDDVNKVPITCSNMEVLNFNKDYMKNYYYDIYGENVQATLEDYFVNYYSKINTNKFDNECVPVNIKATPNYLLIPDQFYTEKYLTNAYNIDWQRIINPLTIY